MNITYRVDKNILYISIEGRIDASNAAAADEQIFAIKNSNVGMHTVIDADDLEYISSAGLRVILKLRKEDPKLAIINVSPDVYEVFDMTGFTDMITVEKAYKRLSIDGCEFIAKGANGAVYKYDDETIVKTYFSKDALPEIQQERESARKAFVLGVSTAIPYGIVRIGDGYGSLTEMLDPINITKLICNDPMNLDKPVEYFIDLLKSIHAVEAEEGDFPDMREISIDWVNFVSEYLPEKEAKKLCGMVNAIPKMNVLLHGDYHTNNVMLQKGEPLIIDLDTLCVGHPIFELGSMYNAFLGFSEYDNEEIKKFMGFDRETSKRFWRLSIKRYIGTDDEERYNEVETKASVIGYVRLLRRTLRRMHEAEAEEKAAFYKKRLIETINMVDSLTF